MKNIERSIILSSLEYKCEEEYWLSKLGKEMLVGDFLEGLAFSRTPQVCPQRVEVKFTSTLTEQLLKLSKGNDLSLYLIVLTAYKIVLSRYIRHSGLTVFSPVYKFKVSEKTLNDFVPMYTKLNQTESFKELLLEVRSVALEAYEHQNYPFDEVVAGLGISRLERCCTYDLICLLNTIHDEDVLTPVQSEFTLHLTRDEGTLQGEMIYNSTKFPTFLVDQMVSHLVNVLQIVTQDVNIPVGQIDLLLPEERLHILTGLNRTEAPLPTKTVHQLVEEFAETRPEHTALIYAGQKVTYRDLNERANRLALYLQKRMNGRETVAGILMERSPLMVVSILAIWKARGAYIPLDPQNPAKRSAEILADSGAGVLITSSEYLSPEMAEVNLPQIIDPVREYAAILLEDGTNPNLDFDLNQLAYVIYTSGSTGKPKGAMVEHLGMMNHIEAKITDLQLSAESVIAQNASHCFDISVWQFFAALSVGGTTVIISNEVVMEPGRFMRWIAEEGVTILEVVPFYLSVLLGALEMAPIEFPMLRYLLVTGETVKPNLVERWFQAFPQIPMVNAYGPTEASDDITHHIMVNAPAVDSIPIGKPLRNFRIYIVDETMQPTPIGVKGEICVAGIGVGRGYLNDPERTTGVFMDDPFAERPGVRLYKTGDLGRWLPDGTIEFSGRKDYQVKIRGFRIELGEIESRLMGYPGIRENVVVDREVFGGDKQLCAYFVADRTLDISEIKKYLGSKLPDYMIPAYFMQLENMPLNKNGKIDRKALPAVTEYKEDSTEYRIPQTRQEEILIEAYQEILRVERVGTRDNFFLLGGDSITAMQIISYLQKNGLQLKMRDLIERATIEELAQRITPLKRRAEQGAVDGSVEVTPIQTAFFDRNLVEPHHYNQAVMLYRKEGFDIEALRLVFTRLVEHHDALRMIFVVGDEPFQYNRGLGEGELFSLESFDLRDVTSPEEVIACEVERIQSGIQLMDGPLVKLGVFQTKEGDHLLIVVHHLVIDGVSWRILLEDLAIAFKQVLQGLPIVVQDKTDSYREWAEQLYSYANSPEFLESSTYWQSCNGVQVQKLPRDHFVEVRTVRDSIRVTAQLSEEETEILMKEVAAVYDVDHTGILLTALGLALKEWTGETTVYCNLEEHGREDLFPERSFTRTIGWFTAEYPVKLDFTGCATMEDSLRVVQNTLSEIPNHGTGYGILKYLTDSSHKKPVTLMEEAEVTFNYLGRMDRTVEGKNGLFEFSPLQVGNVTSPENAMDYTLEINGILHGGQLSFVFIFNKYEYEIATIEALAQNFTGNLQEMIRCHRENRSGNLPVHRTEAETEAELHILSRLNNVNGKKNIFAIHPSGGSVFCYKEMAQALEDVNVYAIRAAGFSEDEVLPASLAEMVRNYIAIIKHVQNTGPYTILGYSFGGAIAYEIALELERMGDPIDKLIVIDYPPFNQTLQFDVDILLRKELTDELIHNHIDIPDIEHKTIEQLLEMVVNHHTFKAMYGYLTLENLKCIHNVRRNSCCIALEVNRRERPVLLQSDIHWIKAEHGLPNIGENDSWQQWTDGKFLTTVIPGEHYVLFKEPYIDGLIDAVRTVVHSKNGF